MKASILKIVKEENFLSLTGNMIIAIFGFAGFAILARTFSVDVFGQWVLFISSGVFVEMFRFGITNTAIVRYLSGANSSERLNLIGSNGLISLIATLFIIIILVACHFAFPVPIMNSGYDLFFNWYPVLALVNLPFNTAMVILQADREYGKILLIKAINSGGFFIVLLLNFFFLNLSLSQIVYFQVIITAITSIFTILKGWSGFRYLTYANKHTNKLLLDFGKYTTFTLIGTNLLRSADTLIISLSPLGTAAVALYSIPLKLTEIQQIPLRSFAATAFPKMSKASIEGRLSDVRKVFYSYSGAMTYLFIFVSLITFLFADFFVQLLGGSQYLGSEFNTALIVRIFSVYGLLLPIDRMTGIGLDSINRPDWNFYKVVIMVVANIIGDLVAVFIFKSLAMVAVGSIIFTAIGVWVGYSLLNRDLKLQHRMIFAAGKDFYSDLYVKIKNQFNSFAKS